MARIRTVKPEFFRDEDLQDLELRHPEARPMLVYAGLWGHCDKQGVFEWKPRVLKLDILPFLPFEMEATLGLLADAGLVEKFEHEGKFYGFIDSFTDHQRIGGKEHSDPAKHPGKPRKHRGSNGEAPEQQQGSQEGKGSGGGKGRELEGKGTAPESVDNSERHEGGTGSPQKSFPAESFPLEEPQSRKNGTADRRNGDFERINDGVSKLLATGVYTIDKPSALAQALQVSTNQVEVAIRQLRDRGRLPAVAA